MRKMAFSAAIDDALSQAMAEDPSVIILGEDVHMIRSSLRVKFGEKRVRATPISESAFLGAAVTAAMAGMRPVVEVMLIDFIAVAIDALVNHAAKIERFSAGRWGAPLVVRASCGGGYGDGGQHEQSLWGWLAHIPGLAVVVPATPADAGGLMLTALEYDGPVVFLEHKLLSEIWLDYMGGSWRKSVSFDIPLEGAHGPVPDTWQPLPLGKAIERRAGSDLTIVGLGVDVHRALEAAERLQAEGISAGVLDLRWAAPLDAQTLYEKVSQTGRLLVVDEDYQGFGLSGEVAAILLEAGLGFRYRRVCTQDTIPYARDLEAQTLPNVPRILAAARELMTA